MPRACGRSRAQPLERVAGARWPRRISRSRPPR